MSAFELQWICELGEDDEELDYDPVSALTVAIIGAKLGTRGALELKEYDENVDTDEYAHVLEISELSLCCNRLLSSLQPACSTCKRANKKRAYILLAKDEDDAAMSSFREWCERWLLTLELDPLLAALESEQLHQCILTTPWPAKLLPLQHSEAADRLREVQARKYLA